MPYVKKPRVTTVARRDVITRRLANPMGNESLAIPSNPPKHWVFRIGNGAISPDHIWRMRQQKGWDFAEPADIAGGLPEDFGFEHRNGRLIRGDRGQEVLLKMLASEWRLIQQAKSDQNTKQMKGIKDIPERAAAEFGGSEGSEAADVLHKSLQHIEITEKKEIVRSEDYQS
jgi:hypothetical protein